MTPSADITLVASLYRSAWHLPRFVRAVSETSNELAEAGRTLQLVVVANDSTPAERFWIARLACLSSTSKGISVDVLHVQRETLYRSWNRGVALAQGECIGFWNCDDVRSPLALLEGLETMRKGADIVYFRRVTLLQRRGPRFASRTIVQFGAVPEFERGEFRRSMHAGPFFLFSRRAWATAGPFDPQFRIAGDFDWCSRAAESLDFVLGHEIGGVFVRHSGTLSGGGDQRQVAENNIVYLRSHSFDKLEPVSPQLMGQYQVDLPWRKYDVPEAILRRAFGASLGFSGGGLGATT